MRDECVHSEVVTGLRADGHDVIYAAESSRQTDDAILAQRAIADRRILLTEDKDFGDIVFRDAGASPAIVLLRFTTANRHRKWPSLRGAIARYGASLERSYTVITASRVRSRPLAPE